MRLDDKIKEFVKTVGAKDCKKAGLASVLSSFYCGMPLNFNFKGDADEVANELGLSRATYEYWEDLFYKRDSWLNKEADK